VQSLDKSCVAAVACNLIYLKTGKIVSEAYAASKIATLGGFSVTLFDGAGINRDQAKAGVIPFLAEFGINANVSAITGRNLGESNLSSALQSGAPFMVRSSSFVNPGHMLTMQYDSGSADFRVIDSAGRRDSSGGMQYDYRMTPAEAWNAVQYRSPGGSYLERWTVVPIP